MNQWRAPIFSKSERPVLDGPERKLNIPRRLYRVTARLVLSWRPDERTQRDDRCLATRSILLLRVNALWRVYDA